MVEAEYRDFNELANEAPRGEFFETEFDTRGSSWAVIAIHGGKIEPVTDNIALEIANEDGSFYVLRTLRNAPAGRTLHLTSSQFDDPDAVEVVHASLRCLSIHGRKDRDDPDTVWIGGRDEVGRDQLSNALIQAGFLATVHLTEHAGLSQNSICNRTATGAGVQLEVPWGLRQELQRETNRMSKFADACRQFLIARG